MAKAVKKKATKKVAKKTVKRKEPKLEITAAAETSMPESMNEFSFTGKFSHHTGSRADATLLRGSDVVFRDTVKLDCDKSQREYVNNLLSEGSLMDAERAFIECNPTALATPFRKFHNTLRDARESKAAGKKAGAEEYVPVSDMSPYMLSKTRLAETPLEIIEQAKKLATDPNLIERISSHIALAVAGEEQLARLNYMFCTSRLLDSPICLIVTGASASGKSYSLQQVGKFMPDETVLHVTDSTENALYYMSEHALEHRIILGGERRRDVTDANADKTRPYREMVSEKKLTKHVPVRQANGTMKTEEIVRFGPIALSESTTSQAIDAEDSNRCVVVNTDESAEQTARIIAASDEADEAGNVALVPDDVYAVHWAFQRMLVKATVRIPFAKVVGQMVTPRVVHNLESRRAWPQCKQVIKASALLYQFQREQDNNGTITATLEDYRIARGVLGQWLEKIIHGGLSDGAENAFPALLAAFNKGMPFTIAEAVKAHVGGDSVLRKRWLPELERAGVINTVDDSDMGRNGRGRRPQRYRVTVDKLPEKECTVLPTVEEIQAVLDSGEIEGIEQTGSEVFTHEGVAYMTADDGSVSQISANGDVTANLFGD